MSEMPKAYDFAAIEERLYQWWEENGWFKPEARPADAKPFVISIPPPNVTGELHMGHGMFVALEDLMIRRARMQGRAALWVPGTDHAGIATQLQVQKLLISEGTSAREIGRDAFLERTWEWKRKYGGYITQQLRRLGASCDWDRERFTLDEGLVRAVREAFVRMYRMGLIYQDEYLVNWSPGLQTAVSDLEVEYSEEQGSMYYFKYPLKEGGYLEVATTRPETILGDTAVAVHPDDPHYSEVVGRTAIVPMLGREIPVIADDYVSIDFGTGALKVTPGHDPNDFLIGQRHGLAVINILNKDATMSEAAGPYSGLDRFEARQKLWADMEEAGLTIKTEAHTLSVPRSQRGGEIVEPLISRQWFVAAEPMAKLALEAVHSGRIRIVPDRFEKIWDNWLENIRPWCISRQLWWGHRIPVWTCSSCGHQTVTVDDPAVCEACGSAHIVQDPDVLDTWFSSGLWPFSTLGWPEQTPDLQRFYPTDVMETGYDILFFWVARMVMSATLFTNDIPFHTVYLHGLVRNGDGRKMSKTAGNVTDPLDVMAEYGTDALRFTLLTGGTPGNDLNLSLERVASNRNFANKIWNATRFVTRSLNKATKADAPAGGLSEADYTAADKWILTRLSEIIETADRLMDNYLFGEAGRQVYDFLWSEFADWYLELAKVQLNQGGRRAWTTLSVLRKVLDESLRLLHPYIPFVTEETWQQLKAAFVAADLGIQPDKGWAEALIIADWPAAGARYEAETADFNQLQELVRGIRAARSDNNVEPARYIIALIAAGDKAPFYDEQRDIMSFLARLDDAELRISETLDAPENALTITLGDVTCYLPLAGLVDLEQERERLSKELADLVREIERVSNLLAGPFAKRAPANVVQKERDKLARLQASREEIEQRLDNG
ncbi:MAG: valine--tRNA ligase [Candidatus Promineifilaceae bacterium]